MGLDKDRTGQSRDGTRRLETKLGNQLAQKSCRNVAGRLWELQGATGSWGKAGAAGLEGQGHDL